jgi:simple sugar transport system ATP-binding protein
VKELADAYGFQIDPRATVEDLSVGEEQRVEILKALYRGVEILILDEPTAVLTPSETSDLFENLRRLQADGKSIVFISHKLDEVLEIADRITVLRRGACRWRDHAGGDVEGQARRDDGRTSRLVPPREAGGRDR